MATERRVDVTPLGNEEEKVLKLIDEEEVVDLAVAMGNITAPSMTAMIAEILKYIKGFSGVWFPRHDQMARWVLRHADTPDR